MQDKLKQKKELENCFKEPNTIDDKKFESAFAIVNNKERAVEFHESQKLLLEVFLELPTTDSPSPGEEKKLNEYLDTALVNSNKTDLQMLAKVAIKLKNQEAQSKILEKVKSEMIEDGKSDGQIRQFKPIIKTLQKAKQQVDPTLIQELDNIIKKAEDKMHSNRAPQP